MVVPTKAATAGVTSAILVVAWSGIYLSRHSRSSQQVTTVVPEVTLPVVYEVVTLEENATVSLEVENDARRDKVKEVKGTRT
jgi:hypothetical protein